MKVVILYRPASEHSRRIEEFVRAYQERHEGHKLEILSLDTRDGAATASLYDVVRYPAILVLQNDGAVRHLWQGEALPLMDEVASYANT